MSELLSYVFKIIKYFFYLVADIYVLITLVERNDKFQEFKGKGIEFSEKYVLSRIPKYKEPEEQN